MKSERPGIDPVYYDHAKLRLGNFQCTLGRLEHMKKPLAMISSCKCTEVICGCQSGSFELISKAHLFQKVLGCEQLTWFRAKI